MKEKISVDVIIKKANIVPILGVYRFCNFSIIKQVILKSIVKFLSVDKSEVKFAFR